MAMPGDAKMPEIITLPFDIIMIDLIKVNFVSDNKYIAF